MPICNINSKEDARSYIAEQKIKHVHVALTDMTGQLRGKYVSAEKFLKILYDGLPLSHNFSAGDFTDVILPIDGLTAGDVCFGDGHVRVAPETGRIIPWESNDRNLFFLLEYSDVGAAFDPRALLGRVIAMAQEMGYTPYHACELEFRLFRETQTSLRDKDYRKLVSYIPASNYLGTLTQTTYSEFFRDLTTLAESLDIPIESAHWELGAGFGECVFKYDRSLRSADNAVIYKTYAKAFALRNNLLLSFMARFDDRQDGSSCHIHMSLKDSSGTPVFHDSKAEYGISRTMRHFIGGTQQLLPELMLMLAPNVNSFKRFIPGIFAPVAATWGIDNRTTAIRVIRGSASAQRIEHRVPGADVNPYLATACVLAAGLWGIRHGLEPTAPVTGNGWNNMEQLPRDLHFPRTFEEAIDRFSESQIAHDLFGAEFVRVFAAGRRAQAEQYRAAVTDWELRRFLEYT